MKMKRMAITAATLAMVFTGAIAVNAAESDVEEQLSSEDFISMRYEKVEDAFEAGDITEDEYDAMIAHIEQMEEEGLCDFGDRDGDGPVLGLGAQDGEGQGRGMGNGAKDGSGEGRGLANGEGQGLGKGAKDGDGEGRGMGYGSDDSQDDTE